MPVIRRGLLTINVMSKVENAFVMNISLVSNVTHVLLDMRNFPHVTSVLLNIGTFLYVKVYTQKYSNCK